MSAAATLQTWRPIGKSDAGKCSDGCPQDAAYDRTDGRCYLHGKIADGKITKPAPAVGRPIGRSPSSKRSGTHHRKH